MRLALIPSSSKKRYDCRNQNWEPRPLWWVPHKLVNWLRIGEDGGTYFWPHFPPREKEPSQVKSSWIGCQSITGVHPAFCKLLVTLIQSDWNSRFRFLYFISMIACTLDHSCYNFKVFPKEFSQDYHWKLFQTGSLIIHSRSPNNLCRRSLTVTCKCSKVTNKASTKRC